MNRMFFFVCGQVSLVGVWVCIDFLNVFLKALTETMWRAPINWRVGLKSRMFTSLNFWKSLLPSNSEGDKISSDSGRSNTSMFLSWPATVVPSSSSSSSVAYSPVCCKRKRKVSHSRGPLFFRDSSYNCVQTWWRPCPHPGLWKHIYTTHHRPMRTMYLSWTHILIYLLSQWPSTKWEETIRFTTLLCLCKYELLVPPTMFRGRTREAVMFWRFRLSPSRIPFSYPFSSYIWLCSGSIWKCWIESTVRATTNT